MSLNDGMVRTQIQFEEEELSRLKKEALRRGCSVSAVVRDSVKTALDSEVKGGQILAVMELAGKYNSGRSDLAGKHDSYLDDGW